MKGWNQPEGHVAENKENETCQPADVEKQKRDAAIIEELTELAKLRSHHNLTVVGQEEGMSPIKLPKR